MAAKKTAARKSSTRPPAAFAQDLLAANRILSRERVLDGYGHVSARHPGDPSRYLLSRSLAPELVTAKDLMLFDLDSKAQGGDDRPPYLERFIHGEIYRARPDVMAIVHSHSAAVIPFASSTARLRPIYHMSGFLHGGTPVFDIRKRFGNTDMLVRNAEHGKALAAELAGSAIALMRGHGFVAVAESIPLAVYRAIYAQQSAAIQQSAVTMGGEITYLNAEESAQSEDNIRATVGRPWALWKKSALKK
jgi:ribulose-5-phosphate 4-epimerase/fuculose-1-phosphate aldolase